MNNNLEMFKEALRMEWKKKHLTLDQKVQALDIMERAVKELKYEVLHKGDS